jgi:hypothetical protein
MKRARTIKKKETTMTLQQKLSAMKQESLAKMPSEVVDVLQGEMKKLIESNLVDKAIKAGEALPEFALPDEQGNLVSSKEILEKGPLALSFYRGIW